MSMRTFAFLAFCHASGLGQRLQEDEDLANLLLAFTPARVGSTRTRNAMGRGRKADMGVGLFYATSTGNTEEAAELIGSATGLEASDYEGEDFSDLDGVIVGAPTWHTGADEQRSGTTWDEYLETIAGYDLKGKKVAVFGCGDSQGYGENFCDAIEELHNTFQAAGATMVGYTDASGYDFDESKSVKDGKFLGLPLDQDNEDDQSEGRVAAWVEQLKAEGMAF